MTPKFDTVLDSNCDSMDLDLPSTENCYEGTFDGAGVQGTEDQGKLWTGGMVQTLPQTRKSTKPKKPSGNPRGRQSIPGEALKNKLSLDGGHGTRQRGRPRLDTRDETATEVRSPRDEGCVPFKVDNTLASSNPNSSCSAGLSAAERDHHLRFEQESRSPRVYDREDA